ncbi:unnamed protein product [Calicophoron daubneyi]|uniref:SWIM-type domain-containing protein n=1 Tax=Calicophoron daubneyi TaxID=300641 RepID=A0AAV2TPK8_CALDB
MRNTTRLRTFMVDLSYAQMNAIRTVFGGKKILLCQFHLLRAVHRKCKNKVIWHYVKRMMGTVSVMKFNAFCQRLRRKFPGFYIYFCRVWLRHAHRWAVCYRSGTVCLGNQTNNRCESAHRWLKEDLCPADSLFNCCKRVWLSSHQMLVDYMCDVALSRIRRPVITFNNPLAGVVNRLTRYAAERIVKEWDSSNSRMSVVGVAGKFKVMEEVFTRRIAYTVDLKKVVCSCMFSQFYAMPCRHLVFAVMEAKVPIDRVLVNSRWLDCYLDGVEPPEVSFTGPPHREKKVKKSVVVTRRMNQLERCMSEDTYIAMLDKVCTVMDAFEIAEIDDEAILRQKDLHEIPPLRERISQPQTSLHAASGTTIFPPHTSPPLTAFTRAQPSKLLTSATTVPRRKKVPLRRTMPVDLDVEDKENAPIPGTSYPSESQ